MKIEFENGNRIESIPTTEETIRGKGYVRAYQPTEGMILSLSHKVVDGKGKIGDYLYLRKDSVKLSFNFNEISKKFAIVMEIPSLHKRIKEALGVRHYKIRSFIRAFIKYYKVMVLNNEYNI